MSMEKEVPVKSPSPPVDEPLPSAPHTPLFLTEEDPVDESPSVETPQGKGKERSKMQRMMRIWPFWWMLTN